MNKTCYLIVGEEKKCKDGSDYGIHYWWGFESCSTWRILEECGALTTTTTTKVIIIVNTTSIHHHLATCVIEGEVLVVERVK